MRRYAKRRKITKEQSFSKVKVLNEKEIMCMLRHLMVQQKQEAFNIISRPLEACERCSYLQECLDSKEDFTWVILYKALADKAGVHVSFRVGSFPLVKYPI